MFAANREGGMYMARRKRSSMRDPQKEGYWRQMLTMWQNSGLSQAEFCRQERLNANTFSSWKAIIPERDAELETVKPVVQSHRRNAGPGGRKPHSATPAFVKLEVGDTNSSAEPAGSTVSPALVASSLGNQLAAELIAPQSGCLVRVFNGADHSTLSALVAALANG